MLSKLSSSPDTIDQFVQLLRVLGDPTRLRLLGVLQGGEANVSSLCEHLSLPQPTVSHHLGLLRAAKLVANRRAGKQVFYSLNAGAVSNLQDHGGIKIRTGGMELNLSTADGVTSDNSSVAGVDGAADSVDQREARVVEPTAAAKAVIETIKPAVTHESLSA